MDEAIKKFASKYAAQKLGQHFLIDRIILSKIIEAADISEKDIVLEVGPGVGILTEELLKKSGNVVAVEKDERLIPYLKELFKDKKNFHLYTDDILKFNVGKYVKSPYKLVANIPYYLTSKLIRTFLEKEEKPQSMILMIQREVAERIISKSPRANILSISVQFYGTTKIIDFVPQKSFYPQPKVESAIIKIDNIVDDKYRVDSKTFFRIVKIGFSSPRKKLLNNLANGLKIPKHSIEKMLLDLGLDKNVRAEVLEISDWVNLCETLRRHDG